MSDWPKRPSNSRFEGWGDFTSWALGMADTVRSYLKKEPIELFGDVKFVGVASTVPDIVLNIIHEYRTRRNSTDILGDFGSIEGKLFLTGVAPWLAIAALVIDPFILHPLHRQGVMDVAGETGKTVVQQFLWQFPRDMDALAWLVRFASERTQSASRASLTRSRRPLGHLGSGRLKSTKDVPHPNSPAGRNFDWSSLGIPHPNSPAGRTFSYWSSFGMPHPNSPVARVAHATHLPHRSRPESKFPSGSFWSELDKAIAQDDKDFRNKGRDDFLKKK